MQRPRLHATRHEQRTTPVCGSTQRGRTNGNPSRSRHLPYYRSWTSDGPGDCGGGDIGFGVAADGTFELPCQAGGHIIQVQIGVPDDGWKTLGEGHVVAVADSTVTLEIRLTTVWPTVAP
jgi:hypothetical protein